MNLRSPTAIDPLRLAKVLWPDVVLYDKQREIVRSVWENDATYVPAGNQLGKDFIAGMVVVLYFLTRHPCRIVTTSAKDDHLDVLWAEIGKFINNSKVPLDHQKGGPLIVRHRELKKVNADGLRCAMSYVKGMVASEDSIESMGGHHVPDVEPGVGITCCGQLVETPMPRNMFVVDEASGVRDGYMEKANPWAKRVLVIGNCYPCENFFKRAIEGSPETDDPGGDRYSKDGSRCYRKVIKIRAEDSPNVILAQRQIEKGIPPTYQLVLPGVKTYTQYVKDREELPEAEQTVKLDAEFYKGREARIFPIPWLNRAAEVAASVELEWSRKGKKRVAYAVGIDPAEGQDSTAMAAVDDRGLFSLESSKTPDTDSIYREAIRFCREWGVPWDRVCIDHGGGGKQLADRMRAAGYPVRIVPFGAAVEAEMRNRPVEYGERKDVKEARYEYVNRRAQLYYELAELLDPSLRPDGFGLPARYYELRRQLTPIPRNTDPEGRLKMLPKDRRSDTDKGLTLKQLLGRSPDEADALVLAVHGLLHRGVKRVAQVG